MRKAPRTPPRLPVQQVASELRDIGSYTDGLEEGRPVSLLHDFGYDIPSYVELVQLLGAEGYRAIVPSCAEVLRLYLDLVTSSAFSIHLLTSKHGLKAAPALPAVPVWHGN